MASFPIFLTVHDVPPLVVGDSDLAIAKVRTLLLKAPRVTLAAHISPPALAGRIAAGAINVIAAHPAEADVRGRPLVIAATRDDAEDVRIYQIARALGVPVNVPDRPELCTFTLGAFVDRGDVTVAISTNGTAPVLATLLRARLERVLDPRLGRVAAIAGEYRSAVEHRVPRGAPRRAFWTKVVSGAPARAILKGDEAEGRRLVDGILAGVETTSTGGRVILVGAGPGDSDLLTLKAVRALKSADVILHDALVDASVLDHARREALVVNVGKRAAGRAMPQDDINAMLVDLAGGGKIVVRLKGGDALVFGRAAEEIAAVQSAGIAVEVIPGITAAQACAAEARLPLTVRQRVRQVSLVTGTASDGEPDLDWDALARPGQAFAIYMGVRTADRITARLVSAGADPSTSVVIVENGGRANRRTVASSLLDLPSAIKAKHIVGPAVVFVGLNWADAGLTPPVGVEWFATPAKVALPRSLSPIDHFALSF